MYFIAINMTLSIFLDCSSNEDKVNNIQESFDVNVVTKTPINEPFFIFKQNGLNFIFNSDNSKSLHVDFLKGSMGWRLKRSDHEKLLKKTLGRNNGPLSIFDGTAGLLSDTLIFLALGHRVIACEQSKILFLLISDALKRARVQLPFIKNLKLLNGNSAECYKDYKKVDVIYLDPMYPEPKKNVLRSGNIALIKDILQIEMIEDCGDNIFFEFKENDYKKIVLKRPIKSDLLDNKFNYQIKGKSTRFDVYI
jgi:16S rRNA (guanine1516-N2)-methyltransferase